MTNPILRNLPVPLLVTIFGYLLMYLSNLQTTSPSWAFVLAVAIFILTYVETYLQKLENPPGGGSTTPNLTLTATPADNVSGKTVTFTVTGAVGTWQLFVNGETTPMTAPQSGTTLAYNMVSPAPLYLALQALGTVEVVWEDSSGNASEPITLTA